MHGVRQEYQRVACEIECGNESTLACPDIQWPSDNRLCFPLHLDSSVSVTENLVQGVLRTEQLSEKGEGLNDGPISHSQVSSLDSEDGAAGKGHGSRSTSVEDGAVIKTDFCLPDSGVEQHSPAGEEANTQTTCLPICPTSSVLSQSGSLCSTLGDGHADREPPCSASPSSSYSSLDAKAGPEECVRTWWSSTGPVASNLQAELPRNRKELLEVRTQLVMELLWIKQAISSRQKAR